MTITYQLDNSLYVNVTNLCSNNCSFCIRNNGDGVGDADNLWLEREPSNEEIAQDILKHDLSAYQELIFCGYGEPLERLDAIVYACKKAREVSKIPIRINTNGQADLIAGHPVAEQLKGLVDTVSISLNAPDARGYNEICQSEFGEGAFDAILKFAADCKNYVPHVVFTVVDVIGSEKVERCRKIAEELGVEYRVRKMIE